MHYTAAIFVLCFLIAPMTFAQNGGLFKAAKPAALQVSYQINTAADRKPISPYIYGSHQFSDDGDENIAIQRLGSTRLVTYNWENNASNAGSDYFFYNDNFLCDVVGVPMNRWNEPAAVQTIFHEKAKAIGCKTVLTLQAAGYVSRDKNGEVLQSEAAPSNRWDEVKFRKGAAFTLNPDLNDGSVYDDEQVNYIVNKFGNAQSGNGVNWYGIDNEPGIWYLTQTRMHPNKVSCQEIWTKTVDLALAVKDVDPGAEIIGGVFYGFDEYSTLQDAPDWGMYSGTYGKYADAFLDKMREAETTHGKRLVDVLDLHWYPEAGGMNNSGQFERIALSDGNDPGVVEARLQAPRTLWDPTYLENSYIAQNNGAITLIPSLKQSIATYYPGTKLAFGEFDYGGYSHVAGGIALADVLGIFATYGVYMAMHWNPLQEYISTGYKLYRNYDGQKSAYGDMNVSATTGDYVNSSVYAAVETINENRLHVIVMNKSMTQEIEGTFSIQSEKQYARGDVYYFDAGGIDVRKAASIDQIAGNGFSYTLPALSAYHIILDAMTVSAAQPVQAASFALYQSYPNPAEGRTTIRFAVGNESAPTVLRLYDPLGRLVETILDNRITSGEHTIYFDTQRLMPGLYFLRMENGNRAATRTMLIK